MTNQEACDQLQRGISEAQERVVSALKLGLYETVASQCQKAQNLAHLLWVTQELDPSAEFTAQL